MPATTKLTAMNSTPTLNARPENLVPFTWAMQNKLRMILCDIYPRRVNELR